MAVFDVFDDIVFDAIVLMIMFDSIVFNVSDQCVMPLCLTFDDILCLMAVFDVSDNV